MCFHETVCCLLNKYLTKYYQDAASFCNQALKVDNILALILLFF